MQIFRSAQLLFCCWTFCCSLFLLAPAQAESGKIFNTTVTPLSLNLNSSKATISGSLLETSRATIITIGGTKTSISPSSSLTPAEYLAALTVISTGGHQTLTLNSSGAATSGTFLLPAFKNLATLIVPAGISGAYDVSASRRLSFSGDFVNSGSFYFVSSNHSSKTAVLSALNIINNPGALLSSNLPRNGISGFTNLIGNINKLTIKASDSITNYGSITSSGKLYISAGNQFTNLQSDLASSTLPSISSGNTLKLTAPSITNQGQISSELSSITIATINMTNSGMLKALKGDITLGTLYQQTLNVDNFGGTIEAKHNLTFSSDTLVTTNSAIEIFGGALYANKISFNARYSSVTADVNDISPVVGFSADNISLVVLNGTAGLTLSGLDSAKSVALSYNGCGNISSSGFNTLGNKVSIKTTGSINIAGDVITSSSDSGNAGSVLIDAGTNLWLGKINTSDSGNGNGGNISLEAGNSIDSGDLNASGGASGNPGIIFVTAGKLGSGNATVSSITDNGVSGEGIVTITTPGSINVHGTIAAIDGTVTLQSANSNTGKIGVGTDGHLNINQTSTVSDSPYILDLNQLAQIGSGNVSIVKPIGSAANIVLSRDCNQCLGNLTSVTLDTDGGYSASGSTLSLAPGQSFTVIAAGNINTGSVSGGQNLSFLSGGTVTVDGLVNSPDSSLTLSGSSFSLKTPVNVGSGSVALIPTSSTIITGSQIANISASTLIIGNGSGKASVTLSGNSNLSSINNHVIVSLGGDFISTSASLNVSNLANMALSAANISTGNISGGTGLILNARQSLNVAGNLNIPDGPIVLNGDLGAKGAAITLLSGNVISASSITVSSGTGNITSGSNMNALNGAVSISAGGSLNLLDHQQISATGNLTLSSMADLSIGNNGGSGVSLSAGTVMPSFNPFITKAPFNPFLLGTSGTVLIDSFQSGSGSGSISIGSNVNIVAAGNGQNGSGNLALISGGNLSLNSGSKLAAAGGNLWLSASGNLSIDSSNLVSLASSSAKTSTDYSGGQIGILAGAPATNMNQVLNSLRVARSDTEKVFSPVNLNVNNITLSNGSSLAVVESSQVQVSLAGNTINLSGGVAYIDPPPNATVNVVNSSITAVGPQITAPPLTFGSVGVARTPGNINPGTNTGSGGIVILPPVIDTGASSRTEQSIGSGSFTEQPILSTDFKSSSVSQTDLSSFGSNSQQITSTIYNSQSSAARDTLEEVPLKQRMNQYIYCSKPQLLKVVDSGEEDRWIIASSSCQPFTFEEHDGSLIVGTGPAKFAPAAERTLLLQEGKMLVITVDKVHVIRTPFCNITIPLNTASIVEVDTEGMVRLANLAGGKASISICRNDETLILSTAPGEQLVLAEAAVPNEQFCSFAFPEVAHSKVAAWNLELSGLRGQKMHFDRNEMAQHEPLLHCSMGCVNQAQLRQIQQLMQSMTRLETQLKSMVQPARTKATIQSALPVASRTRLRPISYQNTSLPAEPISLRTLNTGSAIVKYLGHCKVSLANSGLIELADGEALVAAARRTIVRMGLVYVELKPGAVAIVGQHDGLLKVRNIYEKKSMTVLTTVAAKRTIGLQVGQELIIGPKGISLTRALSDDPVGRRQLTSLDLASGHTCISSEISLSSLLQNSSILAQIIRSSNSFDQEMARRIMKMAVCLSVISSSHGNYSMVNP